MGKDHSMRIFDKRGKLRLVGHRHQGAVEFVENFGNAQLTSRCCFPVRRLQCVLFCCRRALQTKRRTDGLPHTRSESSVVPPGFRHGRSSHPGNKVHAISRANPMPYTLLISGGFGSTSLTRRSLRGVAASIFISPLQTSSLHRCAKSARLFGDEPAEGIAFPLRGFPRLVGNAQNAVDVDQGGFCFNDERAFV